MNKDIFDIMKDNIDKIIKEEIEKCLLNELSAKIVRPNDSLSARAEVWTRGTSGGGSGDRNDKRGHFHYFTKRGNDGFYVTKNYFHLEIAIDNLCQLQIVRTNDVNGQHIGKNGGSWNGMRDEKIALEQWLNEPNKKSQIPNWVEILDNWNNENPNNHVKVLYSINEKPFDLDLISDSEKLTYDYPHITFSC
jgi:hypothetical protein